MSSRTPGRRGDCANAVTECSTSALALRATSSSAAGCSPLLRLLRLRSPPDLPASAALRARSGRAGDRVSGETSRRRRPEAGAGREVEIQKRAGADVPFVRVRGVEAQRRGRARAGQRGEVRASRVTHALTPKRARRRDGRQGAGEVEEGRQRGHLRFGRGGTGQREGWSIEECTHAFQRARRARVAPAFAARARRARGLRDKKLQAGKRCRQGKSWRTWSMVLSPLAFRGLSGVNIPGGSWVLSMSRSAGRAAARCAFTRAREAAVRTKAGSRSATRSLDGEKSAKLPLRHRRSAGEASATVRGARGRGIERALRVLETTFPRASSVSRETSRAACEVRTAITKHLVSRRAHHADVTTRKVLVRDAARRFGSSRAPRRPKVAFAPAERTQKSGVTFRMRIQSRARERMRNERALTGALSVDRRG